MRALLDDPEVDSVVCAPGNAGIAREARTAMLDLTVPGDAAALALSLAVDLVVVGPR